MICGLLGEKLSHSYSPVIHAMLSDYEYGLYEVAPSELEMFVKEGCWDGLNVTIPYKKAVIPFCSELSPIAKKTGSVNTLVKRKDKTIYGDNTDAFGFESLVKRSGADIAGKKVLILGSGGACASVRSILNDMHADTVVISRTGSDNYGNLDRHKDAAAIVNTTPLGMYPGNGKCPLELSKFPECRAVFDLIYNPARTALMLRAEQLGIPSFGGLYMLVAQAKRSSELFTGKKLHGEVISKIEKRLSRDMQNIVLIGMPGCGKSIIAQSLGSACRREVIDTDKLIEERVGTSTSDFIKERGEAEFRRVETQVLADVTRRSGCVISTGGGCVTVPENRDLLRQNGVIVWVRRDISLLSRKGRPLSQNADLGEMYKKRRPMYESFSDVAVDNDASVSDAVKRILEEIE